MVKSADSSDPAPASSPDAPGDNGQTTEDDQRPSTTGVRPLGSTRQKEQRDSSPRLPPRPGTMTPERVVGRCEIFAPIAGGSLASVYVGRLIGVGGFARTVAVKLLHEQYAKDPAFRQMFLDEAHVVSRVRHPNVVPTLDLVDEGDELFIVMEYVEGDTLARLMKRPRRAGTERPPVGVTLSILSETLHGLHAAHEARDAQNEPMNLVHRDVTPHNILVGTDGYARLMDFGIAHALGQARSTRAGEVKGEPGYLAPEQVRDEALDFRADVFSASVVLWHALTGQQLFTATAAADLAKDVLEKEIEPPSKHVAGISPQLDAIVLRGLERDPEKRWPSAAVMAEAIETLKLNASHREVGTWVRKAAHEELSRRAALIAGLERAPIDNEGMEQNSTLPVYRMPAKDGSGAFKPGPAETEGPASEPTFDDDGPLDEASLGDPFDEPVEEEAGCISTVAKKGARGASETRNKTEQTTDKGGRAPSAAKTREGAAGPSRPNRRQFVILAGTAVGIGAIAALVTLTGGDEPLESRPERPAATGQATLPQPSAPTTSSPTPEASSVEPVRSAPTPTTQRSAETAPPVSPPASAAPAESASASPAESASAAPSSTAPPVVTGEPPPPEPSSTSLYGRE